MSEGSPGSVDIDISDNPGSTNKVSKKDGGKTYTYSCDSKTITIKVDEYTSDITTYKKLTYTLPDKSTIKSITYNGDDTNISTSNKLTCHVYYWDGDTQYDTPLIVQLDEKSCYKYEQHKWTQDGVASVNLGNGLNKQNCLRNQAHQIDISKKNKEHSCNSSSCMKMKFTIKPDNTKEAMYQYTRYTFTPQSPGSLKFLYFTHIYTPQIGLPYPENVKDINIYWKTNSPGPSLVHYKSKENNIWYRTKNNEPSRWEEISQSVNSNVTEDDVAVIIKRLIDGKYLPTITIDVGKGKELSKNLVSTTYKDPDGGSASNETISVSMSRNEEDIKGYDQFIHKPKDDIYFKLQAVKHGGKTLEGIKFTETLASITSYYWNGDKDLKVPLLIELVTAGGTSKHMYYNRPLATGGSWTREEHPTQLPADKLKKILGALKKTHFPESNTGLLAGSSVGTGLGGAGLGGLAVWKGPALIARLIARF